MIQFKINEIMLESTMTYHKKSLNNIKKCAKFNVGTKFSSTFLLHGKHIIYHHSIATAAKLRSLKQLILKTPLLLMWQCINQFHNGFRTRTGGWELWLLSWRWHILSISLKAGRGISAETCGLDDVFPPDDLGYGPCTPFITYIPHIIAAFLLIEIYSF